MSKLDCRVAVAPRNDNDLSSRAQRGDLATVVPIKSNKPKRAVNCTELPVNHNLKPGQQPNVTAHSICLFFSDQLKAALMQQKKAGESEV